MSARQSPLKAQGGLIEIVPDQDGGGKAAPPSERQGSPSSHSLNYAGGKPTRRRSGAVRFGNKQQADNDVLLVKANREELQELKGHGTMCGAVSSVQGWRKAMEDRHALLIADSELHSVRRIAPGSASPVGTPLDSPRGAQPAGSSPPSLCCSPDSAAPADDAAAALPEPPATPADSDRQALDTDASGIGAFLGIYDGHNGTAASSFAATALHRTFALVFARERPTTDDAVAECCRAAFSTCDEALRAAAGSSNGGCTAACALVLPNRLVLCSAGDCRCAVVRRDRTVRVAITDDHTVRNPRERARLDGDGIPVLNERVRGVLGVTRALGDFHMKPLDAVASISATPEVVVVPREDTDAAVLIGCDGVWETQQVPAVARTVAGDGASGVSAVAAASCCAERPLAPGGLLPGSDNVSIGAIFFSSPFDDD